jgi:hydrogenase maturation protease
MPRILVAGVGNVFLSDDGFGVEVVKRLLAGPVAPDVKVTDFGIRGVHLAYELMDTPYELTILVDATARGGAPGTVYVIEPDMVATETFGAEDAHGMTPDAVFAMLRRMGVTPGRILVVGCEPASLEENMGLSPVVEAAVDEAVRVIQELVAKPVSASL